MYQYNNAVRKTYEDFFCWGYIKQLLLATPQRWPNLLFSHWMPVHRAAVHCSGKMLLGQSSFCLSHSAISDFYKKFAFLMVNYMME